MSHRSLFLLSFVFYTLLTCLSSAVPFFWDNILLGSQFAHHFYDSGFSQLIPNAEVDAGHPMGYGVYLAAAWTLFGKTLAVSHWAIWPFLLMMSWYWLKIADHFLEGKWVFVALLLLWIEPTILTQCVMGTSDVVLLAFSFGALWCILSEQRKLLSLFIIGMAVVSLRGIYWALLLYVFDLFNMLFDKERRGVRQAVYLILPYLPAALITIAYYGIHYQQVGWLVRQPGSRWSHHYGMVWESFYCYKRTQFLLWRFVDFGRLFVWISTGFALVLYAWNRKFPTTKQWKIIALFLIPFVLFSLPMIPQKSPMMHRYYMLQYLMVGLLCLSLLINLRSRWLSGLCLSLLIVGQLTGHLWLYPDRFGMGWDATLGHLPYYSMKAEMLEYIDEKDIAYEEVLASFPMLQTGESTDLNGDLRRFKPFREKILKDNSYLLQTNINNGFLPKHMAELQRDWVIEKEFRSYPIYLRLWRKK